MSNTVYHCHHDRVDSYPLPTKEGVKSLQLCRRCGTADWSHLPLEVVNKLMKVPCHSVGGKFDPLDAVPVTSDGDILIDSAEWRLFALNLLVGFPEEHGA